MRALTVIPGRAHSAMLLDVPEPPISDGSVLVEALAIGVCGTDLEIVEGHLGWAAPGRERLILGHESLGRVIETPADSGLNAGDLVVGIVRRPDPVPCVNCGAGEWDMCRNGRFHRTRDQGTRRVRLGALPHRARVCREGGPVARESRRVAGTGEHPGEGVGKGRSDRGAIVRQAQSRARPGSGADRPPGGHDGRATGAGSPRFGSSERRAKARAGPLAGRDLSHGPGEGRGRAGRRRL